MAKPKSKPKAAVPAPAPRPPLTPAATKQFKKDVDLMRKQGQNMDRLKSVIETLCSRRPLAPEFRDHPLKGQWKAYRECHIAPDWLLIYRTTETELTLTRTGSHADLFGT